MSNWINDVISSLETLTPGWHGESPKYLDQVRSILELVPKQPHIDVCSDGRVLLWWECESSYIEWVIGENTVDIFIAGQITTVPLEIVLKVLRS